MLINFNFSRKHSFLSVICPIFYVTFLLRALIFHFLWFLLEFKNTFCKTGLVPVDARALYTEGDAQIDAGPAGIWLTAVAAAGVARDSQDLLQGALSFQWPLLRLPSRVQTPCRRRGLPVQLLAQERKCLVSKIDTTEFIKGLNDTCVPFYLIYWYLSAQLSNIKLQFVCCHTDSSLFIL